MQPHTSAAVSGGLAAPIMVVAAWLFSLIHVEIPTDVQVALAAILTAGLGYLFHTRGAAIAAAAKAAADTITGGAAAAVMLILVGIGLAGCDTTGALTPQGKTALTIGCKLDAVGVPLATAGAKIAAGAQPEIAPEVVLGTVLDAPLHAQVQDDCAKALAPAAP